MRWQESASFGKENIEKSYTRNSKSDELRILSDEEKEMVRANVTQNITSVVAKNKKIEFYYFFPPYSIYFWDSLNQSNYINKQLDAERIVIEECLQYDNCHLFMFDDEFEITTELNNYMNWLHYSADINSYILQSMSSGRDELTADNYEERLKSVEDFYKNYNYEMLFR